MRSARHAEGIKENQMILSWEQTLSLDTTDTCIVHKQTNKDWATTKTDLTDGRKTTKTPRRVSKRIDKLDYTSRFVRVIPTLSKHCHLTQKVIVGCYRMFISTHRLKPAVVR